MYIYIYVYIYIYMYIYIYNELHTDWLSSELCVGLSKARWIVSHMCGWVRVRVYRQWSAVMSV
jgi:hypothetical protein